MGKRKSKLLSAALSLALMFTVAIGCFDIFGILAGPAYEVEAVDSGGSSSSPTTTTKKSTKKKAKKKLQVSGKTVSIQYDAAQKGNTVLSKNTIMAVKNAGGKKTYKIASVSPKSAKKYFKISKKGKLTIKKGLKPGTYTVKIKIKTSGSSKYRAGSKTVKVKIVVNPPVVVPAPAPTPAPTDTPESTDSGTGGDSSAGSN